MSRPLLIRIDREAQRHTRHPRHLHPALDLQIAQAGILAQTGNLPPLVDTWTGPFSARRCVDEALAWRPTVAFIRAVTWCLAESMAVARALRAAGVVTVAVGQQVQHVARRPHPDWLNAFDLAIPGEPEAAIPALAAALAAGQSVARLAARWPANGRGALALIEQPDDLPSPSPSANALAAYPFPFPLRGAPVARWAYLLTAWGCPRPCRHCSSIVRKSVGRPLRTRSVSRVLDEVARWRDAGAEAIAFEDDSLFVHKARFLDLANGLVQRGLTLPWLANARPDELDAERVDAAKAAGARLIKVGIETGSAPLIESIGKAADGVRWQADVRAAMARLDAAGIGAVALILVGLPGETAADRAATSTLLRGLPADYLQVQRWQAYPDIDLAAPDAQPDYHYASGANDEIERAQRRLYREFYLRPGFIADHLRRSWRHYLGQGAGGLRAPLGFLLRRPAAGAT